MEDIEKGAAVLSQALNIEEDVLLEMINGDAPYVVLKRKLTDKEFEDIKNLELEGISLGKIKGRYYPQDNLASQVIGFFGAEGTGQYGLEQYYEEHLSPKPGFLKEEKGSNLKLTINYNLQFKAEQSLKKAKENLNIEGGQIIVVEPHSGKILAMADLLSFNPNQYEKYALEGNLEVFKNRATQEFFEPGSVFKPITMAAAIEEERVTPQTTYFDKGVVKVSGHLIYNYEQRIHEGPQTMINVLEKSINTGAVFVQKELGPNLFMKYIEKFGFLEPTGIDIQETYSQNNELMQGREINYATASFGQGIEMTPIQLVRAYCSIANGGKLVTPYLVEKIGENMNEGIQEEQRVISSKTASQLTAMLVSVVEKGFAKATRIPGYFIAGKTGTAQVSYGALGINKKGYSEKTIQTFVGFSPAFDPKFVMMIKLDNPETKTAEYSAVPIFKEMAEYIIHQYQIPPDYED